MCWLSDVMRLNKLVNHIFDNGSPNTLTSYESGVWIGVHVNDISRDELLLIVCKCINCCSASVVIFQTSGFWAERYGESNLGRSVESLLIERVSKKLGSTIIVSVSFYLRVKALSICSNEIKWTKLILFDCRSYCLAGHETKSQVEQSAPFISQVVWKSYILLERNFMINISITFIPGRPVSLILKNQHIFHQVPQRWIFLSFHFAWHVLFLVAFWLRVWLLEQDSR